MAWMRTGVQAAGIAIAAGCTLYDTKWVAQWRAARLTSATWEGTEGTDGTDGRPYQPIAALDDALDWHLQRFSVGVHILCAPPGAGKTTAVAKAIQRARAHGVDKPPGAPKITGQLVIGSPTKNTTPLYATLRDAIGGPRSRSTISRLLHAELATGHKLTDVIPKGTVIVIDNADTLRGSAGFKRAVMALAQMGASTKTFTTIIIVSDPALALQMRAWRGSSKIQTVRPLGARSFAMPPEQCQQLARAHAERAHLTMGDTARLVDDAALARTPGFVVDNVTEYRCTVYLGRHTAALHDCAQAAARGWSAWESATGDSDSGTVAATRY